MSTQATEADNAPDIGTLADEQIDNGLVVEERSLIVGNGKDSARTSGTVRKQPVDQATSSPGESGCCPCGQ